VRRPGFRVLLPNQIEKNFLVKAASLQRAKDIADQELQSYLSDRISSTCNEIGLISDLDESNVEGVMYGPIIEFAYIVNVRWKTREMFD